MAELLQYTPLQEGEIRLLRIDAIDPLLKCSMANYLSSEPYNALSYTWGTPDISARASINGVEFAISAHLQDALRKLYLKALGFEGPQYFWNDAICLNQHDAAELATQTLLMDHVYSQAKRVIIYLGKGDESTDIVMEQAKSIGDRLYESPPNMDLDDLPRYGLPNRQDSVWEMIGVFHRNSYFRRLWIWQEVVLADSALVGCGDHWIEWDVLVRLTKGIASRNLLMLHARGHQHVSDDGDAFFSIVQMENNRTGPLPFTPVQGLNIPTTLQAFRSRECSQQIDKIFGTMGLWSPQLRDYAKTSGLVDKSPESMANPWRTYLKFAEFYVPADPTLMMLSLASLGFKHHNLPSWCPDWSYHLPYTNFYGIPWFTSGFIGKIELQPQIQLVDSSTIRILGFHIDTVNSVVGLDWSFSPFPEARIGIDGEAARLLAWEAECLHLSQETFGGQNSVPEQHWRTLVANCMNKRSHEATENLFAAYTDWKANLNGMRNGNLISIFGGPRHAAQEAYSVAVQNACKGRKFFSTFGGRVGLGPTHLRKGDYVCAFKNGRPLYVLNQVGNTDRFELVGDAYVEGLMRQEDIHKSVPENERQERTFLVI